MNRRSGLFEKLCASVFLITTICVGRTIWAGDNALANDNDIRFGVLSGRQHGVYANLALDMADHLNDDELRVLPILSSGSVQNLYDLKYLKGIDLVFLQSDVLAAIANTKKDGLKEDTELAEDLIDPKLIDGFEYALSQNFLSHINYLIAFDEFIQIVTVNSDITSLANLRNKKIAIGGKGSGTEFTAKRILGLGSISYDSFNYSEDEAVRRLLNGEIDAAFVVAANSHSFFDPIYALRESSIRKQEADKTDDELRAENARLVNIDNAWIFDRHGYKDTEITAFDNTFTTAKVSALIAVWTKWNKSSSSQLSRCENLTKFTKRLRKFLGDVQSGNVDGIFHPMWKKIGSGKIPDSISDSDIKPLDWNNPC